MTDEDIITQILKREGGFVDHPNDKGGPTNFGITKITLEAWRGHSVSDSELLALSEVEARDIYRKLYVEQPGFAQITNANMRGLVVDSGVNHGPKRAVRMLQHALGVDEDGEFGDKTLNALTLADPRRLFVRFCAERVRYYGRIISHDATQHVFALGWANRIAEFIEEAA